MLVRTLTAVRKALNMMTVTDYSSRRIRRQVCASDLQTVQEKQITIPINIPSGLENYLLTTLPHLYDDIPSHFTDFKPIIPVHDPAKYSPSSAAIPSLRDTAAESGNLRYWVITNESMWASQHRVLDEFAELMWSFFYWFNHAINSAPNSGVNTLENNSLSCLRLARSFRRRIVLSEIPATQKEPITMKPKLPSLRETLLFGKWAMISPAKPVREFVDSNDGGHWLFDEEAVLYPFPDDLFWNPSDEGTWDEEGVPEWIEVPAA